MSPTTPASRRTPRGPWHARLAASLLAVALLGGCGDSKIHQAPARPSAEGVDGGVELSWTAVPDAKSYVIRWEDETAGETRFPNVIKDITDTSYLHSGLTNFHTYRYQVYAKGSGGEGPGSLIVSAEPGPVPASAEWTVVVTDGDTHKVYFDEDPTADGYRVYIAATAGALIGRRPNASFVLVEGSPWIREDTPAAVANYYRVIPMNGPRIGFDGPIVINSVFGLSEYELPEASPALADLDGDGCLDLVGATGNCLGAFEDVDLAAAGLDDLFAAGRNNGDSRLADVNADGRPDIYSDVLSAATVAGSQAILHVNQGNGTFQPDASVAALGIGGFGGTVLAADFDNDGDVDLFAPHDWTGTDGGRNWLLRNTGSGFTDATAAAGLLTGPAGAAYVPGGGQAVDFDADGDVDLLFGSRLMLNDGDGTFSDASAASGLTAVADRGLKLVDIDMDGDLDLVRRDASVTRLSINDGGVFGPATTVDGDATTRGEGLAVCDINSDGFEDLVVASNSATTGTGGPRVYVNVAGELMRSDGPLELSAEPEDLLAFNDLLSCADIDGSGVADVVSRWGNVRVWRSALGLTTTLRIRVLGAGGEYNQQGRLVRIVPQGVDGRTMTRVVESGSGLRAQGDYDLLVGAPWGGEYEISVRFKDGWVTATAEQGDALTIYADGRVEDGLN
jgi:hypothetical protein